MSEAGEPCPRSMPPPMENDLDKLYKTSDNISRYFLSFKKNEKSGYYKNTYTWYPMFAHTLDENLL